MIIKKDECLKKYTTIKIGGKAKKLFIPENKNELLEILNTKENCYLLGGGSNILIKDDIYIDNVVSLSEFDKNIYLDHDMFYVGASVSNQHLINYVNKLGYGGIEYLYSVPGLLGGAIVMNAGRGMVYNQSISDYLVKVIVYKNGSIYDMSKEECNFSYRNSIFKNKNYVILGAYFKFDKVDEIESKKRKKERIDLCRRVQDAGKPNFGSVFSISNGKIMLMLSKIGFGHVNGCHYSKKTVNWIINEGNGKYKEILKLIKITKVVHKLLRKKCILEVIIWD